MATGKQRAVRTPRNGPRVDTQPTKAPRELCRRVGAIAAMTGETIAEVWGRVTAEAMGAEFDRVTGRRGS